MEIYVDTWFLVQGSETVGMKYMFQEEYWVSS